MTSLARGGAATSPPCLAALQRQPSRCEPAQSGAVLTPPPLNNTDRQVRGNRSDPISPPAATDPPPLLRLPTSAVIRRPAATSVMSCPLGSSSGSLSSTTASPADNVFIQVPRYSGRQTASLNSATYDHRPAGRRSRRAVASESAYTPRSATGSGFPESAVWR